MLPGRARASGSNHYRLVRPGKLFQMPKTMNSLVKIHNPGLVANPKKTSLLILNLHHKEGESIQIKVGNDIITRVDNAKLLGMTFEDNQKWKEHINCTSGVISSLNQRLFFIRRLKNSLNHDGLRKVADSLFTSKLRYGLQL